MSLATQPHASHSQRSFPAPRSDAQIREHRRSRPWKHGESTGLVTTKNCFRLGEGSRLLYAAFQACSLPIPYSTPELEAAFRRFLDILYLLVEYYDDEIVGPMICTIKSLLGEDWDASFYVRPSLVFSVGRVFFCPVGNATFLSDAGAITGRVGCTIGKKLEELNPESYERQQQAPQEQRLCCKPRHRKKVQEVRFRFAKVLTRDDITRDMVDNLEQDPLSSLQIETKVEPRTAHGRSSLKNWRRAAGKSKSWRPFLKSRVPKQTRLNGRRRNSNGAVYRSAQPPPWLPAAFLRSQTTEKSSWPGYVPRRQEVDSVPRRARRHDPYTHDVEDTPISQHGKHHTKASQNVKTWESKPEIVEDTNGEPAGAFIRFTWKDKTLINGTGQLNRFLSTGSTLHSRWRITNFLRNESFADVYSVSEHASTLSRAEEDASPEAHVFLDEYHGNCAVYASRSKNRMRQSGNCLDTFWHNGRHAFIMKMAKKPVSFQVRNTKEEFPVLVDQNTCNEQAALQRRRFRGRPSFAAMAASPSPEAGPAFRPAPMDQGKSRLEKELQRIERARAKKAERQRVKRKLQTKKKKARGQGSGRKEIGGGCSQTTVEFVHCE